MIYLYPEYYEAFSCMKGDCKHSCCKGWEIDLDGEHLEHFLSMDGEIGEKMKTHISLEGSPHFVLDEEGRCPFLNRNGLCDLILSCGKDVLCDICREHPRYYNEFEDHTEAGLGLCCEAAARLVIGWDDKKGFPYPTPDFSEDNCLKKRNELLLAVKNATCAGTLQKRLLKTIAQEKLPFESLDFAKFLLTLERLDDHWTNLLERYIAAKDDIDLEGFGYAMNKRTVEFENLLSYLLWRHVAPAFDEEESVLRTLFSLQICQLIFELGATVFFEQGSFDFEEMVELVRLFSSEIEYSDENPDRILEEIGLRVF